MQMLIHCPGCTRPLNVPQGASGHHARCPACHVVFVVPAPQELVEETFSAWIEEDVAQAMNGRADDAPPPGPVAAAPPPPAPAPAAPPKAAPLATVRATLPDPAVAARQPDAPKAAPLASTPAPTQTTPAAAHVPRQFPSEPLDPARPQLVVLDCGPKGVRLAFDARHLNLPGFRASMPLRCCVCGNDDRAALVVRPVVFPDQVRASVRTGRHIESHHQLQILANQSARDLLAVMGELEEMERPFHQPMPYCVCQGCAAQSLHGKTDKREDGSIICELHIHCGQCALDWLGRVNGVCGNDYAILEEEVSLMNSDAWRNLPEHVRKRLEVWSDFEPGERFVAYFSDADFGSRDAGLAGLVLTTNRLRFNKYHHHAQVKLSESAALLARAENEVVVSLTLQTPNHRTRLGRYKRTDLEQLAPLLQRSSALTLEEMRQPGEEEAIAAG